ncbi:unnamed protein product [Prunus armeniaca]|uniref:RNase H type-1 domain-containing protein n=1 Tax=Prunus armeniaca TaxID=36596 RepID=A0A6J5XPQ2_PRUAR|nr:unnamed protein product [Prunus armeniaca]
MVHELIDPLLKTWKEDVINRCFVPDEARCILSIPINKWGCPDKLIWHFSMHGQYTVRSSYELALHLQRNGELGHKGASEASGSYSQSSVWKSFWHADAPPKLKAFIWRGCSNILAVRHNLRRRPLQLDVNNLAAEDFISTWRYIMTMINSSEHAAEAIQWFVFGLWRIWKARNSVVFDGVQADPAEAVHLLLQQVSEYRIAKQNLQPQPLQPASSPVPQSWCKPPPGFLKVNCDAAWSAQRLCGGVGWVIRDSFGLLLCAGGQGDLHGSSALMMELLAIRHALSECSHFHLTNVIVESDSQMGISMLNGRVTVDSDLEGIVFDIQQLVASLSRVSFVFAPRSCN